MTSSASEPQPEGKAGTASADAGIQPIHGDPSCGGLPGRILPSVPDHELLRCIGRGAYGAVWLARNVMGIYRAVKLVHRDDFGRERPFTREYEGLLNYEPISRSHPNLMQILHVGRRESYFYYVMELADDAGLLKIEGRGGENAAGAQRPVVSDQPAFVASYVPRTLQEDLERRGRLPVGECVSLATALASALKHLHGHKLVHRDVKPSNVIFVHGVPKLADVGLVATVGDSRSIVGTEGYLPPEGPGTPQADLYALGKLLYEVSTGLNRGEYPRLPKNLAALPDAQELLEFNEVLLKACAKDTGRRYHQAEELLADLALLERGDSVKRLRRLERHHALLKRVGVAILVAGLVVSAAWWQSWRAQRVARRHLAQLHLNEGTRYMAEGEYAAALPWLVGALELDSGDPTRERMHRTRIAGVLRRCPLPVARFSSPNCRVTAADLNADGSLLATAHDDGSVLLWDTSSGKQLRPLPNKFPVSVCQFLSSGDRLLTVNMRQEAQVWSLRRLELAPRTFPQAQGGGGAMYCVGLNESLGLNESPDPNQSPARVYLSKGRYVFPSSQVFTGAFENLTLSLKLTGQGTNLLVQYKVNRTGADDEALYAGQFLDTPKAEPFVKGSDNPAEPIWGQVVVLLENASWGDSEGDSGEVTWDNLRSRRYLSSERPPSWRTVDDFSHGLSTNWYLFGNAKEGRSCRVEDGRLVSTCARLPLAQTLSGVLAYFEQFEISRAHTLEVAVDLISARAPHRMVSLTLAHYVFDPFSAQDRPYIAHGRWLATTWWDAPPRLWDLEGSRADGARPEGSRPYLELGMNGFVQDIDFSPDTNHAAVVWSPEVVPATTSRLRVWNLRTGSEIPLAGERRENVNGARFSPEGRFLAVSRKDGVTLLRTTDWAPATNLASGASFKSPRFSPRGHRLAAVREQYDLVVWDLGDMGEPAVRFSHPTDIRRINFSPDGRYLAASVGDQTVRIWDIVRAEPFGPPLPGVLGWFSPGGSELLVIGREGGVWFWDLSRILDDTLAVPPLRAEQLSASSADGTLTAEIVNQGIRLKSPAGEHSLALPAQPVLRRIAFSPDDQYLIAENSNERAWVWDPRLRTLLGPSRPLRHEASLTNHFLPNLPVEARGQQTLSDLAALLGRHRPDGTGGMIPLDDEDRARILNEFKSTRPAEFRVDAGNRARWHREQALASELAMAWDAAVFHWEQALDKKTESTNKRTGISPESRLDYAQQAAEVQRQAMMSGQSRWSCILPRPPWATPCMVDLTGLFTMPLGGSPGGLEQSPCFRGLANGVQLAGGIHFDVRGVVNLELTNQVSIPIDSRCERLHFLHAASRAGLGRGPVGIYEVTFDGGRTARVELRTPDDVRPYSAHRFNVVSVPNRTSVPANVQSDLAWCGNVWGPANRKQYVYLTRTTWALPSERRGEVVKSIRVQRSSAESAPLLFAITVQ